MVLVDRTRGVTAGSAVVAVMAGAALMATSPAQAQATSIVVTSTADSGPGSLRDALDQAQATTSDDHITFDSSVTGTILLTSGQLEVVVGGSSGSLIIEGPGQDALTVDAAGQSRVVDIRSLGGDPRPTAVVSGLTLTRGVSGQHDGSSSIDDWYGGAVRATAVDLALDGVTVADSSAFEGGGGIAVTGADLRVSESTITGNLSSQQPWGDTYGPGGGGIFFDDDGIEGAALAVHDSTVSKNTAYSVGGGIHAAGPAPVTVTDSTVSDNIAASTYAGMEVWGFIGDGGGIWASQISVVDSRIMNNEVGRDGGGLFGQVVEVTGSTIAGNVARSSGGAVRVEGAPAELRVESSTISDNRAGSGGGLYIESDTAVVEVILSTVAANTAVAGGGVYSSADAVLQGSIVGMNSGGDLAGEGSVSLSRSLVQDPRASYVDNGGSIIGEDPRLRPLADHGGPLETKLPASNSPVIDQGSAFGATTDQRGSPRPVDDAETPDAADGSDIGAVELIQAELAGPPQVGGTSRPTITGRVRVGETLHTDGGIWEPENVSLSYQWLRNRIPIPGATSASYTVTAEDYEPYYWGSGDRKRLSVLVSAAAEGYLPVTVQTDFTRFVAKGFLDMAGKPRVIGRTRVGTTLRAKPRLAAVSPRPTGVTIKWFLNGRLVRQAVDARRFTLKPRMRGQRVKVRFVYHPPEACKGLAVVVKKPRRVR